jgi:ADP-ribosylglycohydrolase
MRVSPVAWWFDTLEETLEEAKRSAAVTHNHPQGIKGACVTAGCIFLGRTGGSKDDMLDFAASMGYDVSEPVDSIRRWYRFDETCQGTVPQAVRCAYEGESYEEVIRLAVSLGGDSDTLAAIAGSVAEAFNGIPDSILEEARTYLDPYLDEVVQTFRTALTVPREQRDLTRRVNENLQEATRLVGDGRVEEAAVVVWETESACRGFKEGRGRRRRRVT